MTTNARHADQSPESEARDLGARLERVLAGMRLGTAVARTRQLLDKK